MSYLYHETVKKYRFSEEKKLFGGFLGKTAQFIVMVLYRYLRLLKYNHFKIINGNTFVNMNVY